MLYLSQGLQGLSGLIPTCFTNAAFPHLTRLVLEGSTHCSNDEPAAAVTASSSSSRPPPLHTLALRCDRPVPKQMVATTLVRLSPTLRDLTMEMDTSGWICTPLLEPLAPQLTRLRFLSAAQGFSSGLMLGGDAIAADGEPPALFAVNGNMCACLGRLVPPQLHTLELLGYQLGDADVKSLLKLPALVRLQVASLTLRSNHNAAAASCSWREVILDDSTPDAFSIITTITSLARLPLQSGIEGGGVVQLRAFSACHELDSANDVTAAVRHLLSLEGWRFGALQERDAGVKSEGREAGCVEVWVRGNDGASAVAVMQLVVAMQDVRRLRIVAPVHPTGLLPSVARALLSVLSAASSNAAAPSTTTTTSSTLAWTSIVLDDIQWQGDVDGDDGSDQLCGELLPCLTAALPELQHVRLCGETPPERVAALCAAPGILRPITLTLEYDRVSTDAAKQAHMQAVQQAVAAAVTVVAVSEPSQVTIEWVQSET